MAGFCCVECGSERNGNKAYIEYSKGTLKLKRCVDCGKLVDKYIEFEWLLIIIDMMLLRETAFRHVLRNNDVSDSRYIRFLILGLVIRCYVQLFKLLDSSEKFRMVIDDDTSFLLRALFQMLAISVAEIVFFFGILFFLVKTYVSPETRNIDILKAVILCNYCIVIFVPMTIWMYFNESNTQEYPTAFVRVAEMLVLLWLTVAIKAISATATDWITVIGSVAFPAVTLLFTHHSSVSSTLVNEAMSYIGNNQQNKGIIHFFFCGLPCFLAKMVYIVYLYPIF